MEYLNVQKAFDEFFKEVIKQSRANLTRGKNNASKDLYNSLDYNVNITDNSISADFLMEDYADFLDKGVKGVKSGKSLANYKYTTKKPPVNKLLTWSKYKSGKFRRRNQRSEAFRIQNIVYNYGIKPTEFFSKPFENEFKKLPQEIIEAYGLDVEDFIDFVLNKE